MFIINILGNIILVCILSIHYSQKANISAVFSDANGVSVYAEQYIRPSITLKPGTSFVNGNGSIDNPYTIE